MKNPIKKLKKSVQITRKKKLVAIPLVLTVLIVGFAFINKNPCSGCVYSQDGINITGKEYNDLLQARQIFYKYNNKNISEESIKSELIKELVNHKKVVTYALNNNIKVTDPEIESLYQARIQQNSNEEKLLQKVKNMYGYSKTDYKKVLERDILWEKVQSNLDIPLTDWLLR